MFEILYKKNHTVILNTWEEVLNWKRMNKTCKKIEVRKLEGNVWKLVQA